MTDKVLRELLISVKQQGAARVTKSIKAITDGLQDAAAGAELTNNELDKMPKTLLSVEKAADRAAKSMAKISANKGFKIQGLDKLQTSLTSIESKILITCRTNNFKSSGMPKVSYRKGKAVLSFPIKIGISPGT